MCGFVGWDSRLAHFWVGRKCLSHMQNPIHLDFPADEMKMARLARLELATSCFGGTRSIQLSYSRVFPLYHAACQERISVGGIRVGSESANELT